MTMAMSMEDPKFSGTFVIPPRVPQGLAAAVEGLTREVIRHRPEDIYIFAARHFDKLLRLRERYGATFPRAENNLRALWEMNDILRSGEASRARGRSRRDVAAQSGWSFNETAKVLGRNKAAYDARKNPEGVQRSLDEAPRVSRIPGERRHMEKYISPSRKEARRDSSRSVSGNSSAPRIISQMNLPGSTGMLDARDIKTELRRNRISGGGRRPERVDGSASRRASARKLPEKASRKVDDDRTSDDGRALFESSARKTSRALSVDRTRERVTVADKIAGAISLEELQSASYVEKVGKIVSETAPIIRDRVDELKSGSAIDRKNRREKSDRGKRSRKGSSKSDRDPRRDSGTRFEDDDGEVSKKRQKSGSSGESRQETGERGNEESTPHGESGSNSTEPDRIGGNIGIQMKVPKRSKKERRRNEETICTRDPNDSLEGIEPLTSESVESATPKSSVDADPLRSKASRSIFEDISVVSRCLTRSNSAKEMRNADGLETLDLKVSLPAVRPSSSRNEYRGAFRSNNFVLPPISPEVPKSAKAKEEIALPVLTPPSSSASDLAPRSAKNSREGDDSKTWNEEPHRLVAEKIGDSKTPREMSEDENEATSRREEKNEKKSNSPGDADEEARESPERRISNESNENDVNDEELMSLANVGIHKEGSEVAERREGEDEEEEVFKDSLNVTPDIEICTRPDSLEREDRDSSDKSERANLERYDLREKLMEIEEVGKNIEKMLDSNKSTEIADRKLEDLEVADENLKDKLREVADTEMRITGILNSNNPTQEPEGNLREKLGEVKSYEERIEGILISNDKNHESEPTNDPNTNGTQREADLTTENIETNSVENAIEEKNFEADENSDARTENNLTNEDFQPESKDGELTNEVVEDTNVTGSSSLEETELRKNPKTEVEFTNLPREVSDETLAICKVDENVFHPNSNPERELPGNQDTDEADAGSKENGDGERPEKDSETQRSSFDFEVPRVYVLSEGSPHEIPESVVTVIIPDGVLASSDNDILGEKVQGTSMSSEPVPENSLEAFGEIVKPESASPNADIDFIRAMKPSHDLMMVHQDLDQIQEEEDKELDDDDDATESRDARADLGEIKEEDETVETDETQMMNEDAAEGGTVDDGDPFVPKIRSDSESTEAKETTITDELPEMQDFVDNSLDVEENTDAASMGSTNEVKESTLTDQTSLSLDPGKPIVPELNLDSLQDVTISSFKLTDDRRESDRTISLTSDGKIDEDEMILKTLIGAANEEIVGSNEDSKNVDRVGLGLRTDGSEDDEESILRTLLEAQNDDERLSGPEKVDVVSEIAREAENLDAAVSVPDEETDGNADIGKIENKENNIDEKSVDAVSDEKNSVLEEAPVLEESGEGERLREEEEKSGEALHLGDLASEETSAINLSEDHARTEEDVDRDEEELEINVTRVSESEASDDAGRKGSSGEQHSLDLTRQEVDVSEGVPRNGKPEMPIRDADDREENVVDDTGESGVRGATIREDQKTKEEEGEGFDETRRFSEEAGPGNVAEERGIEERERPEVVDEEIVEERPFVKERVEVKEEPCKKVISWSNGERSDTKSPSAGSSEEGQIRGRANPDFPRYEDSQFADLEESNVDDDQTLESRSVSQCTTRRNISDEDEGEESKEVEKSVTGSQEEAEASDKGDASGANGKRSGESTGRDLNAEDNLFVVQMEVEPQTEIDRAKELESEDGPLEIDISERMPPRAEVVTDNLQDRENSGTGRKEYHIYVPEPVPSGGEADDSSSTETSTFNSAATKIQAGVRGFLTRRRLQSSTLDSVPSISDSFTVEPSTIATSCLSPIVEGNNARERDYRGYQAARHRLRREDAVRGTTFSIDGAFAENGLQHTGEFHDCVPLPLGDFSGREETGHEKPKEGNHQMEGSNEPGTNSTTAENEVEGVAKFPRDANEPLEPPSETLYRQNFPKSGMAQNLGRFFFGPTDPPMVQLDFGSKLGEIVDFLVLAKEESNLENRYLNFITSIEDFEQTTSAFESPEKDDRSDDRNNSMESVKEPLALPGGPTGVIIEEITSLDEPSKSSVPEDASEGMPASESLAPGAKKTLEKGEMERKAGSDGTESPVAIEEPEVREKVNNQLEDDTEMSLDREEKSDSETSAAAAATNRSATMSGTEESQIERSADPLEERDGIEFEEDSKNQRLPNGEDFPSSSTKAESELNENVSVTDMSLENVSFSMNIDDVLTLGNESDGYKNTPAMNVSSTNPPRNGNLANSETGAIGGGEKSSAIRECPSKERESDGNSLKGNEIVEVNERASPEETGANREFPVSLLKSSDTGTTVKADS